MVRREFCFGKVLLGTPRKTASTYIWSAILLWISPQLVCVCISLSLRWTHTWSVFWRTSTLCSPLQESWKTSRKQCVRKKVFECWIWNCVRSQYVYIPENMRQICMSENTMGLVIKITSDQLNGSHKQWLGKVWWHTFYQNHSQQFNRAEPTLILLEIHSSKSIWSIMVYLMTRFENEVRSYCKTL